VRTGLQRWRAGLMVCKGWISALPVSERTLAERTSQVRRCQLTSKPSGKFSTTNSMSSNGGTRTVISAPRGGRVGQCTARLIQYAGRVRGVPTRRGPHTHVGLHAIREWQSLAFAMSMASGKVSNITRQIARLEKHSDQWQIS